MQIAYIHPDLSVTGPYDWDGVSPLDPGESVGMMDLNGLVLEPGATYDPIREIIVNASQQSTTTTTTATPTAPTSL